jgi:uncharacterized protein (TIGR02145 family)
MFLKANNWKYSLIFLWILAISTISCTKNEDSEELAVVTTIDVTSVTYNSAVSGGTITSGFDGVSEKGVCWSTNQMPTTADSKLADVSVTAAFTSNLTGLTEKTVYYLRAYAINSKGTSYGNEVSFTTPCDCPATVTDINGNSYNTVIIGNQCWMAENLKVSKYNNGDDIGTTNSAALDISNLTTPKYQWAYSGVETNAGIYGRLYTWFAATDSRKIAPSGWHIPSDAEWDELTLYLGGNSVAGGKMKSTGLTYWETPNTGASNTSGFSALPGGNRNFSGPFFDKGFHAAWWSSTVNTNGDNGNYRMIHKDEIQVRTGYYADKKAGLSVRCIKD